MVSKNALTRAVARLRLTKYFPGSDTELLAALAVELKSLCATDAELTRIVDESIKAGGGEWPGLGGIHEASRALKSEREVEAKKAAARAERDEHERTCTGYVLDVDEAERTVRVQLCNRSWMVETHFLYGTGWISEMVCRCRGGEKVRSEEILNDELHKRPGYESWESKREREYQASLTSWRNRPLPYARPSIDEDGIPFD